MFSFEGDTVLDPFCGTGTTMLAALKHGRNSIGVEIDPEYCQMAARHLKDESRGLFSDAEVIFEKATGGVENAEPIQDARAKPSRSARSDRSPASTTLG